MRVVSCACLARRVACLSVSAAGQQPASPAAKVDASQVLAAAREALGGEARLAGVKTFVATGRTRQVRGDNLLPIEFEIACELPDKFVRKDEIPAQESGPTSTGFNGEDLIQLPVPHLRASRARADRRAPPAAPPGPPGAAGRGPQGPPPGARTATVKQDFARLTLGMFAASFPSYPLTFTHAGLAEAPQGEADVLDVKGPGNFSVRYFVDRKTHLPIMVSWTVPATNVIVAHSRAAAAAPSRRAPSSSTRRPRRRPPPRRKSRTRTARPWPAFARRRSRKRSRSSIASTTPTTARSMASSSRSGCAARWRARPSKRPRSIDSASTPRSIRGDSRCASEVETSHEDHEDHEGQPLWSSCASWQSLRVANRTIAPPRRRRGRPGCS